MDILHLVDRLEELFNNSRPIWLTKNVIINEDKILDIIDQMRVTIPEEMKKAQQVLSQRDRILAQAQEEANRTLALAREKSDRLMERDSIAQAARVQANEIISKAHADAERGDAECHKKNSDGRKPTHQRCHFEKFIGCNGQNLTQQKQRDQIEKELAPEQSSEIQRRTLNNPE